MKAELGQHDENITIKALEKRVGKDMADNLGKYTLELYSKAAEYAATKGIIIADTKFEFGTDAEGTLVLGDEVKRLHPIKGFVYHSVSWDPFADEVPLLGACLVDHDPTNFAPILGCVSFRHIMVK